MATCKTIKLLGTSSLVKGNKLLVYNSRTFRNTRITNILGLSDYQINILVEEPTITTINDIYDTLRSKKEFILLDNVGDEENKHFIFNNDNLNCLTGEGFDTMIFLENEHIIGYIVLLSPLGNSTTTQKTRYTLNKTYLVKLIDIYVDSKDNGIRVDEDTIKLVDSLPKELTDLEGYTKKKDLDVSENTRNNYSFRINSHLKSIDAKDIFTDFIYAKKDCVVSKLKLKKNINIGPEYSEFNHEQVGYYKGDPCLFIWNDNCEYSIFSLTVFIDDLFGIAGLNKPKSYTYPKKDKRGISISTTNIYKIPKITETTINQKILYFSGRYVVIEADGTNYLFDIDLQDGEVSGSPLYEKNNGWVPIESRSDEVVYYLKDNGRWIETTNIDNIINIKIYKSFSQVINSDYEKVVGIVGGKKELTTSFIVDSLDPFNKLVRLDSVTWQTYKEAISKYYPFSNVYNNIEWCILSNTIPYRKIGEWIVFKNKEESTITYSNMTKVVKFRENEEPIIVNDQTLIGKQGDKYVLYDEPGYFVSKAASELENLNEKEIFFNNYKLYDESITKRFFNKPEKPLDIQKSFLGPFRRNVLPETVDNFKIIGSLSGIIYYRIGNIINFL